MSFVSQHVCPIRDKIRIITFRHQQRGVFDPYVGYWRYQRGFKNRGSISKIIIKKMLKEINIAFESGTVLLVTIIGALGIEKIISFRAD